MQQSIRFSEIPKTSSLFRDFLYDFQKVAPFFAPASRSADELLERAKRVAAQSFDRHAVADVLLEQNRDAGCGDETAKNIELLRQPDSVAVVAGQQAGLFTGPLYTIYKALTAIKLASELRSRGVKAVPIFWIASEDHDFEEVNHCRLVNRDGQLITVSYTACSPKEGRPVGTVKLCDEIVEDLNELIAALPESEFLTRLAADLRESYQPGTGFADAFGKLMMRFFGKYGVVLINPLDDRLKHVAGKIYEPALSRAPEFASTLVAQSDSLVKAGYHAQVHVSPEGVPLFIMDEGRRTAMTRRDDGNFQLKGKQKTFPVSELLETVRRCPSCFSPNVTLRPIVQDYLLPTVAYIGGPAEVAYFAQLRPVYQMLDRIEPLIVARASMTLIEQRYAKILAKNGLEFSDLFAGHQEAMAKIVEKSIDATTAAVFDEAFSVINEQLDKLSRSLASADRSLADALKGGREKITYQLSHLRSTFAKNRGVRDEATAKQIERLFTVLYPNKNLQEREINVSYFLARYGYQLIDRLYDEVDVSAGNHKLVYL
jgi:bacillithiol synthase